MSYSQMFQWPVHKGSLAGGQFIENTIFLPSNETSGSETSPVPFV